MAPCVFSYASGGSGPFGIFGRKHRDIIFAFDMILEEEEEVAGVLRTILE
jgi:hypothetical protein